jgi:hypothetical protein
MSKTIPEILNEVKKVKPCSRAQIYRHIAALEIEPIGARQKPQQYPADSAQRILMHLGYVKNGSPKIISVKEAKRQAGKRGAK